jgi:hypothetical protein
VCTNNELQFFFDNLREIIKKDAQDITLSLGSGMLVHN